ncbi:unnamed protein product [Medioppia subpectinata]|uniref:Bromo domain-containing protein n=1 Tax=Medioppia subpectinata TaxID=1979941 RepID=A0A7R9PZ51_9ACAR|nr:unnamed protein product [Medioppia subpectinata]CAG2105852.1 unnamed protein product [Medioppia subpectinata]
MIRGRVDRVVYKCQHWSTRNAFATGLESELDSNANQTTQPTLQLSHTTLVWPTLTPHLTVNGIPIERKFVATNMAASDHQCVASPQPSATAGQSAATPDPPVATPTPNAIDTAGPTIEAANDPNQHNDHSLPPLTAALIPTSAPIATPTPVAVLVATPVLTRPVARAVPAVASVDRKMVTRSKLGVSLRRPNKDLPQTIASAATQPPKRVALNQSMKFCLDIIRELLTKKHRDYAWPFYDPVPTQQYPDYLDIVKKPIDLNTIKIFNCFIDDYGRRPTKIETGQYKTVKPFVKDMQVKKRHYLLRGRKENFFL